jgi:HD superfamily phosphohydrolase
LDSASLSSLRDAVHGQVRIMDPDFFNAEEALLQLLESGPLRRLQRIRQLPFSSTEFLAADHTRYAHAIGTAHMAVSLLRRLRETGFFSKPVLAQLRQACNGLSKRTDVLSFIGEHVVTAGLLQDLGELPFKTATDLFFVAHHHLLDALADDFGMDATSLTSKDVFTLHAIREALNVSPSAQRRLSYPMLAYLIAGVRSPDLTITPALGSLRQILDGPVDADRLDYAHRDAHHTLGASLGSTAGDVIKSLSDLSESGPVFDSPGPVSNFTMLRAALRFQVYSSPSARFRYTLLAHVLSRLSQQSSALMTEVFGSDHGTLSYEGFSRLDDSSLMVGLRQVRESTASGRLDPATLRAIDILTSRGEIYQHYWLNQPDELPSATPDAPTIPTDVFVDTYWDEERHRLYKPKSIWVHAQAYSLGGAAVPLESTGGHVSEFLATLWDSPPVQGRVLFFVPASRSDWFRKVATSRGPYLYREALVRDAEVRMSVVDDTRSLDGFVGSSVFLSFSWKDIHLARASLRLLHERRRRYFAYIEDFHGFGGETHDNSAKYASEADAAIILLSRDYLASANDPQSNIYAELVAIGRTVDPRRVAVLVATEGRMFSQDITNFPWRLIGQSSKPFLGKPVAASNPHVLERAIEAALQRIDSETMD